jgi:hypothetical protein
MDPVARIEMVKDIVQETVDRGVTSVEVIHQYIAALPFEAAERLGLPAGDALRERQRRTIGLVYDAVRFVNRGVGTILSDGFEAIEEGRGAARTLDADGA